MCRLWTKKNFLREDLGSAAGSMIEKKDISELKHDIYSYIYILCTTVTMVVFDVTNAKCTGYWPL